MVDSRQPDPRARPEHRHLSARDGGFTLVELLMAIFLFGLVLTGLTGVLISSSRSIGDQRLRTAATRVAVDHLEKLRALPFEQVEDQAGTEVTTPDGREFTVATDVTPIDAATGQPADDGAVKQVTVTVQWTSGTSAREVSYTTAIAPSDPTTATGSQSIGTITMFPSPAVTDATGQPLEDIEVTVPLEGFPTETLVHVSWTNSDGTPGAAILTSTTGLNWRGTIAKAQLKGAIGADGAGEIDFTVSAGALDGAYTLALQRVVVSPPAITTATINRNPITVAKTSGNQSCDHASRCQNTTDVTFAVTATGLDPAQDSVILQFQLYDGTFQEVPLPPAAGQWQLVIRTKTTKFLVGAARTFRFTAIRSSDGATAATTLQHDVVKV